MSRVEMSVRRAGPAFALSSRQIMMAPGFDLALTLSSVPLKQATHRGHAVSQVELGQRSRQLGCSLTGLFQLSSGQKPGEFLKLCVGRLLATISSGLVPHIRSGVIKGHAFPLFVSVSQIARRGRVTLFGRHPHPSRLLLVVYFQAGPGVVHPGEILLGRRVSAVRWGFELGCR